MESTLSFLTGGALTSYPKRGLPNLGGQDNMIVGVFILKKEIPCIETHCFRNLVG
jgi:hypothetical protein